MTKKVAFLYYQNESKSNGGIKSMLQIVEGLSEYEKIGISNSVDHAQSFDQFLKIHYHPRNSLIQKVKIIISLSIYLLKRRITLVHVNDIGVFYLLPVILLMPHIKVVLNIRGIKSKYTRKWLIVNLASRIVVLSDDMRSKLLNRLPFIYASKLTYIHSGVEFSSNPPLLMHQKQKRIIYPAVFTDRKNQKGLLESFDFASLPEGIKIVCIGDMSNLEYVSACRKVIVERGISNNVELIPHEDSIDDLISTSLITLVVSNREGMARAMIESLALGTPCVSFDLPSAREILDKVDSRLVTPVGDYNRLATNLNSLISDKNYDDLVLKSYDRAKELFQKDKMQESYKKMYEK